MLPITNTLHGEVGKGPIRRKLTIVGVTERKRENGANSNPSLNKIAVTFELHLCSARGIKRYFQRSEGLLETSFLVVGRTSFLTLRVVEGGSSRDRSRDTSDSRAGVRAES